MPSPELSTTLIFGEIILIETVIIISASVYFFLKSKNKSKKLRESLEYFLDDEKNRLSSLSETLKKPDFINDEKYNTTLQAIISEENLLYKYIVNTYHHNDLKLLRALPEEIQRITRPCAELLAESENRDADETDNIPEIDVNDAMDEFLSDDEDIDLDIENDPALDLSEPAEDTPETPTEELVETTTENNEIAEIPSDLLNNIPPVAEDKDGEDIIPEEKDDSAENDQPGEIKPEKQGADSPTT